MVVMYDKTNESACKYQESMNDAVSDICEPLVEYFGLSPRTVETHLKSIKGKTGFHSRSQLIKFFLNHFRFCEQNLKF